MPFFLMYPALALVGWGAYKLITNESVTPAEAYKPISGNPLGQGQEQPSTPPALPMPAQGGGQSIVLPAPSSPGTTALAPAQASAPASNGWVRAAVLVGVAILGLKLIGAVTRALFPAPASGGRTVYLGGTGARRRVRIQRRPGSRGRMRGVWEKRGAGPWTFKPFSVQRRTGSF